MTSLSPANRVMIAVTHVYQEYGGDPPARAVAAAVLHAAVDQVVPPDPCGNDCSITECEQIRADFLAIAAELNSTTNTIEKV